jgi:hypothetical protein
MIPDHIFSTHRDHEVLIDENPISKKGRPVTTHLAALRCVTCNKFLKWLSGQELIALGRITQQELDEWQAMQKDQV